MVSRILRCLVLLGLLSPALALSVTPMVAAGAKHTCSLSSKGAVQCWGDNSYSQLGNGNTAGQMTPVNVTGLTSDVIAIAAGANHTCALTGSGGVQCWGRNDTGQLGDNSILTRSTPVAVTNMASGVGHISAGFGHTCAITTGGAAKCWGLNNFGQLGDNTSGTNRLIAVAVNGLSSGVTALAIGKGHTCALSNTTGIKCWGDNFFGQLGDGGTTPHLTPWDVNGLTSGVSALSAGDGYTCALTTTSGGVKCWGLNNLGQLGDGGTASRLTPWDVVGLASGVSAIVASSTHTCALIGGSVKCWGYNNFGQLGDSSLSNRSTAVDVIGLSGEVTLIAAGDEHSCALTLSGGVKCWGRNDIGQLGDGGYNTSGHTTPWDVNGLASGVSAIAVGKNYACAVTTGGGAKCWGDNGSGQLGDGSITTRRIPTDVSGLPSGVSSITASSSSITQDASHTCALTNTGGVKCWGFNGYGQLGDGTTSQQLTAVDVSGLTTGVVAVAAGANHTCALNTVGGVKCWGNNASGQLGDGTNTKRLTAVDVTGLASGVIAIATGNNHTCAVTTVGGVKCWGNNASGQLGDGTNTQRLTAIDVSGLTSGASTLAGGEFHTCALIRGAGAKCWGGDGATSSSTPVDVSGLTNGVNAIVASGDWEGNSNTSGHNCALTASGGIKCWGNGYAGQLGNGSSSGSLVPVDVSDLTSGALAIATGYTNTCAITSSTGMKCWGSNSSGQLGDGTADTRPYAAVFVVGLSLIDNPTLSSSSNPSVINQSTTFTATITGFAPVGTVMFAFGDGSPAQTVTLSTGQAVTTHAFTNWGSFSVTANYSGDNTNMPRTSLPLNHTVITVPDAPAISSFTAFNGSVTLVFTAPASNGGSVITGYKATCGTTTIAGSFPQITVSPLSNGTSYNCTVLAHNSVGDGPPSTAVIVTPIGTLITRYRLYSDITKEHLYTTDANEYSVLATRGWLAEGAIYQLYQGAGSLNGVAAVPFYRLYNRISLQHHWTTDANEYNVLGQGDWTKEGVDGYILPSSAAGSIPVYRLYLNAFGGLHLWTTDLNEKNVLSTRGWVYEGVSGYVVPLQ